MSLLILAALLGCGGSNSSSSQTPTPPAYTNNPLVVPALAGQKVVVLPITLAVADTAVANDPLLSDRTRVLLWADSLLNESLVGRAPEVTWVGPVELRRIARRATGLASDPDHLGHAVLRDPNVKIVPDPLRSQIRTLAALADARYVLTPTALVFWHDPVGVKVEFHLALLDARTGIIGWRTLATASAAAPSPALRGALARMLPVQGVQ